MNINIKKERKKERKKEGIPRNEHTNKQQIAEEHKQKTVISKNI